MDQPVNNINSSTMRALVNAERERRERYAKQMEDTKNILTDFIQRMGDEYNIQIPESVKTRLNLVEVARFAIELANLIIIRQRNAINDYQSTNPDDLKKKIEALESENRNLKILVEVKSNPSDTAPATQTPNPTVQAVQESPAAPLPVLTQGSVEERIVQIAGSIQTIRLGGLVSACVDALGLPAKEIQTAIEHMVSNKLLDVLTSSRTPRRGEEYPQVFQLTEAGATIFKRLLSIPPVQNLAGLNKENTWKEEGPLLALIFEELLPQEGFSFVRYLPEIGVSTPERGKHIFRPHVQMRDSAGNNAYVMYVGERYEKGSVGKYLDDFMQVDAGRMYFVALTARTARQVVSDIHYCLRGKQLDVRPCVANMDDLLSHVRDREAGNATSKDVWFVALQK